MGEHDEQLVFEMGYNKGFKDGIKGSIPKADYENRLRADLVAMLKELDLQIDELYFPQTYPKYMEGRSDCLEEIKELIQSKINSLKEQKEQT